MGAVQLSEETLAVVSHSGDVMWIPPATATVSCSGDGNYPYEAQVSIAK